VSDYYSADGTRFGGSSGNQMAQTTGDFTEVITDQGEITNGVKPVTHTKTGYTRNVNALKLTSWTWEYGAKRCVIQPNGYVSLWDLGAGYYCPPRIDGSNISIVFPKTKEELRAQAMHRFYDTNQTDNLLNVLEAGQLVSSLYGLYRALKELTKPNSLANSGKGISLARGIAKSSKELSNQFLGYSFGWAPLIADLNRIRQAMPKIRDNLRRLAKDATAPHTVTAKVSGSASIGIQPGVNGYSVSNDPSDGGYWYGKVLPSVVPVRIVGVRGRRALEYNTSDFQVADYLMSRFIATGPASLAWELVKFSFVVDWFIDLTSLIDVLDRSLVTNGKKIDKCWWSEKYHLLVPCYKKQHGQFSFPCDNQQVTLSEVSYYHREPMSPDLSIVASGRFGKKQALLSLALLRQLAANLR